MLPPGNFRGHSHWYMVTWVPFTDKVLKWHDLAGNMVVFVPFGLMCPFGRTRSGAGRLMVVAVLALALSIGVETFQVYCHNRFASATDVVFNLAGAVLGSRLASARRAHA